ncbi:MAG TPA: hypothetical protein DIT03_08450 [Candidatus Accumulibacter sp.]|nr:hypothetical protein [Accumulibacter sp.]HCV13753.1 hypothetical protein [Accumulibacter sp.]
MATSAGTADGARGSDRSPQPQAGTARRRRRGSPGRRDIALGQPDRVASDFEPHILYADVCSSGYELCDTRTTW